MPTVLSLPLIKHVSPAALLAGAAAFLATRVLLGILRTVRVPRNLRQFPAVPFFVSFRALFHDHGYDTRFETYMRSRLKRDKCFVSSESSHWLLQVSDPAAIKAVCNNQDVFAKWSALDAFPHSLMLRLWGDSLLTINGARWLGYRKIVNAAFKRSWPADVFAKPAEVMFAQWDEHISASGTVHLDAYFRKLTLDVLGWGVFNTNFHALSRDPAETAWTDQFVRVLHSVMKPLYLIFWPLDSPRNPLRSTAFREVDEFRATIFQMISDRRQQLVAANETGTEASEDKKDLITIMVEASLDEDLRNLNITDKELVNNLIVFLLAGHDTTSTALLAAMYFLAKHPDVQTRAREEVLRVLGDQTAYPDTVQQKQLTYLNAVIRETQRLVPSAAELSERITTAEYTLPDGRVIPKDTHVTVNIYGMHRDTEIWGQDAEQFNPNRFLDGNEESRRDLYEYMAFNQGPRVCVGMQFSLAEQRVVLSMLLMRYAWELPQDSPHMDRLHFNHSFLLEIHNMHMKVRKL